MINLVIVDDIALNRQMLKSKLVNSLNIDIKAEFESGIAFLGAINRGEIDTNVDIVMMDISMPKLDGIKTIYKAKELLPHLKFIVITVIEDNQNIFEAIKNGAHGYLLKDDNGTNITNAIEQVVKYDAVPMSPAIARRAMKIMLGENEEKKEENILTKREISILKELVAGNNYQKIAENLVISPLTVRKHIANIYEKLHVNNHASVVQLAIKNNWV